MFPVTVILNCYAIIVREVITFSFVIVTSRTTYPVSLVAPTRSPSFHTSYLRGINRSSKSHENSHENKDNQFFMAILQFFDKSWFHSAGKSQHLRI